MAHFVDRSAFQGVQEFNTPSGMFRLMGNTELYQAGAGGFTHVFTCTKKCRMQEAYEEYTECNKGWEEVWSGSIVIWGL